MKCFHSAELYRLWRESASPRLLPCRDCNPAHQAAMVAQRRCEYPTVVFVVEGGELVGKLPGKNGLQMLIPNARTVRPAESQFIIAIGAKLLGPAALAELVGVAVGSLPHYKNGNRVLPEEKFKLLRAAVRRGTGLLVS
mgnify:CR=1 FL=1